MTNEQIEQIESIESIVARAIVAAYSKQSEETLNKLSAVEDAVQSAIDGADYSEIEGMTEKEAYNFYYDWASDCIASVL